MEKFSFANKADLQCAQAGLEEVRADLNAEFLEEQVEYELNDAGRFSKRRRAYEKEGADPDDVYIDVLRRKEERKSRDCRHVSALSPIQQWPTKKIALRKNKNERDSVTASARSPLRTPSVQPGKEP